MLAVIFFNKLDDSEKKRYVFSWGLFIILESLILLKFSSILFLFASVMGIALIIISQVYYKNVFAKVIKKMGVDQLFLILVLIISYIYTLESLRILDKDIALPLGIFFHKLSLSQEIFLVLMSAIIITASIPAYDDPRHMESYLKHQPLLHYKSIDFSYRRTLSSIIVLMLFTVMGILFIPYFKHYLLCSFFIVFISIWAYIYWEIIYGYRSWILILFGGTALILSVISITIHTYNGLIESIVSIGNPLSYSLVILSMIVGIGVKASTIMLSHSDKIKIVTEERISHMLMVIAMTLGICFIYVVYIFIPLQSGFSELK